MRLVSEMVSGNRRALARVISLIEDRGDDLRDLMSEIYPQTGKAFILGITGPPGAGKSTVTDRLVTELRQKKQRVAVVAIDPSSPFSGGAILGDRIRMQSHFNDPGVFIRSLGTRGKHGGLSHSTKDVVMALDAAGFDWIIVETAGVGQTELDILKLAYGVCVVLVPESGDGIQMMKAGLMEIADIFVVNKCDRPQADNIVKELNNMIGLNSDSATPSWVPLVIKTQAVFNLGISDLVSGIEKYRQTTEQSGALEEKKKAFLYDEIFEILSDKLRQSYIRIIEGKAGRKILSDVIQKRVTPHEAAEKISKIISD